MPTLVHGKVRLALHGLRAREGQGAAAPARARRALAGAAPRETQAWPGPICALDFTGHGASTVPRGGGYTAEILMADADAALAQLGSATADRPRARRLRRAAARGRAAAAVRGAILCDGPGLAGGGPRPGHLRDPGRRSGGGDAARSVRAGRAGARRPAARLRVELRAPGRQLSGLERPITVCAIERPDWLRAVVEEPGVEISDAYEALTAYAKIEAA